MHVVFYFKTVSKNNWLMLSRWPRKCWHTIPAHTVPLQPLFEKKTTSHLYAKFFLTNMQHINNAIVYGTYNKQIHSHDCADKNANSNDLIIIFLTIFTVSYTHLTLPTNREV